MKQINQDRIWDTFQNIEDLIDIAFPGKRRFHFLAGRIPSGNRVLNIGIGKGMLEELLIQKGVDVYCLDPSKATVERIRKKLNLGEKAKVGYSQSIPFPDNYFDVVVMSEVLEHLEDEVLYQTMKEVKRVLRKDGRFIGTVPADENLQASLVVCPYCGKMFHRWGHVRSFSKESLYHLLKQYFKNVQVYRKYFPDFEILNWKGKLVGILKILQAFLDIKGSNQNFFFEAKK